MAMTSENGPGTVMDQRAAAVTETIAAIRGIEAELGVTPAALDRIRETLIALATRTELFPDASFPIPAGAVGRAYRLAEDPDHRFALYASAGSPGRAAPPHNHTTWAVIAGVYGEEHNVFYRRTDDRSGHVPGCTSTCTASAWSICRAASPSPPKAAAGTSSIRRPRASRRPSSRPRRSVRC
jgi:hypothetical protein